MVDDILELIADFTNPLGGQHLVAVRQARRVDKCVLVEAVGLNDQRVAFQWLTE